MRRLLTGHAVTFNHRHHRVGHLFQNRYKSVVCEEEPYLLELVRYIHLNPLRAGLVKNMDELDRYPWSGHAVLMGKGELAGQVTDEVLSRFGRSRAKARRAYRQFIVDGIPQGRRSDLVGGGLLRSQSTAGKMIEAFDERILGSGEFVENVRGETGAVEEPGHLPSLEKLIGRVATHYDIAADDLSRRTRRGRNHEARSIICHLAVGLMGCSGAEVAKVLRMSRSGVCIAARRGSEIISNDTDLRDALLAN